MAHEGNRFLTIANFLFFYVQTMDEYLLVGIGLICSILCSLVFFFAILFVVCSKYTHRYFLCVLLTIAQKFCLRLVYLFENNSKHRYAFSRYTVY